MLVWAGWGGWWRMILWLWQLFLWVFVICIEFIYKMLIILRLPTWSMWFCFILLWVICIGKIIWVSGLTMLMTININLQIIKLINNTMIIRVRLRLNTLLINPFRLTQRLSAHRGMELLKRRWWILHVFVLKIFLCVCF